MKEESQRIAISELLGWKWYRVPTVRGTKEHRCLFLPVVHEYEGQDPRWLVKADGNERICNMDFMEREGLVLDYPNDAHAALDLTVALAKEGWRSLLNNGLDGSWECVISCRNDPLERGCLIPTEDDFYGAGPTLPKAICEAFLQKHGKWVEE